MPKINHKFTSQFLLWNCVRLLIPYQIIDRILPYPTISGCMYFVCFCGRGSVLLYLRLFCFSVYVSEVSSCLLCHTTGMESDSSLLICLHSREAAVSEINPPLSAGQLTIYFQSYFSFAQKLPCRHAGQILNISLDEPPRLPSLKRPDKYNTWHA